MSVVFEEEDKERSKDMGIPEPEQLGSQRIYSTLEYFGSIGLIVRKSACRQVR